jgi:hypothetical protein
MVVWRHSHTILPGPDLVNFAARDGVIAVISLLPAPHPPDEVKAYLGVEAHRVTDGQCLGAPRKATSPKSRAP